MKASKRTTGLLLGAVFFAVTALTVLPTSGAELRAGVATVDLTPPPQLRASLGGYGARMGKAAEGVHDRVWAKALVVSDGTKRCAIVTADALGFPPPFKKEMVKRLAAESWQADAILLLPSHSHTSLEMNQLHPDNRFNIPQIGVFSEPVYEHTLKQMVSVVQEASRELVAVSVGTGRVQLEGWNQNRRRDDGPNERALTITRVDRSDGGGLAVLIHWTAHPTFHGPKDMLFSGGWPGHLQRTVEALCGDGTVALYYNGAVGDQRPVSRKDSGQSRWERAERYGRELGIVAHELVQGVQTRSEASFGFQLEKVTLPEREPHPDFMKTGGAEYGLSEVIVKTLLHTLMPTETSTAAVRLGDLLVVGVPGEMTAELGAEIRSHAQKKATGIYVTIGGLANEWVSYILSEADYERGGYESSVSFYGSGLGAAIVDGAVRVVDGLEH